MGGRRLGWVRCLDVDLRLQFAPERWCGSFGSSRFVEVFRSLWVSLKMTIFVVGFS